MLFAKDDLTSDGCALTDWSACEDSRVDLCFFYRQLFTEAMAGWLGDMDLDGVPNIITSLSSLLRTDAFRLVEDAIPRSSFRRNYSLVNTGGSPHTYLPVREGSTSSHQEEPAADVRRF